MYFIAHIYFTLFVYFSFLQFNVDIQLSSCIILMNLRILFQRLTKTGKHIIPFVFAILWTLFN